MTYSKITEGIVEQVFVDGIGISQSFTPLGGSDLRDENDEPIEDEALIEEIESKEKNFPMEMIQPGTKEPHVHVNRHEVSDSQFGQDDDLDLVQ